MNFIDRFFRKAGAVDPAPVAAVPVYVHADQVARIQEVSKAARAEESNMSTTPVVTQPATPVTAVPAKQSWIKRLGALFAHGVEKAIALVEKDAAPIESIATTVGTLAGVGPQVQAAEDTFNAMFGEVVQVEQVATAVGASEGTGVQKLNAAIPQVEQIILSNPLFKGKTITDLTKWNNAIASITGSLYDLGNSVAVPTQAPMGTTTTS